MTESFDYAALTRNDPNPVKRYLQARRLKDALDLLGHRHGRQFVDYGAGDGELVRHLKHRRPEAVTICFEPWSLLSHACRHNIEDLSATTLVETADDVPDGFADAIFCLEVFEHLPAEEIETALHHIARILKHDGVLIVGVPVETGPVARLKGWFRGLRRNDFDTDPDRIAQAARGDIRFERFRMDLGNGGGYYPHHLGFDYRDLLRAVDSRFVVRKRQSSPFGWLPPEVNSELNLLLTKRT
ncbi:bifunctional 2-polyprenyl-6-hydroxyphenol methylase/3-demethylubiquinol 3-O-methyltransferase UbiG [Asticcacaulis sp. YBE204]|uniref:class I SAM-dependent methyltransferase n=1 Tax=Asticcacaulis sp. YBE204 TaxID=1282363 RepID=UPI0003C3AEE8|nr:class I SAM-dependent methyltransferase [Asticcacaulis sp. YBE204]ESQ79779.1 hypothetical protein AEYBE204_08010 [Asticcacaulis sp. YBE204]